MLVSTNPFNGEILKEYHFHSALEQDVLISTAQQVFSSFKNTSFEERARLFCDCAENLRIQKLDLAKLITAEMGKPIQEAIAEVEKCAQVCEYYADNAEDFLAEESIDSDAGISYVRYEPIGVVLAIMPWNFPFWQVFRFATPTIMAGNTVLLKHASNVPQCAEAIEKIFIDSGFPKGIFSNIFCKSEDVKNIISNTTIKAVTITGSEKAGASVAENAGKHLKKTVLELGGNDAFIVLADADLALAVTTAIKSRLSNAGQSCIAAKRFIIEASVMEKFTSLLIEKIKEIIIGNPIESTTQMATLARNDLAKEVHLQVSQCIKDGATLLYGNNSYIEGTANYAPVVLGNINKETLAYHEEIFGPVFSIIAVANETEAIAIANDSKFGLGASIWTSDHEKGMALAKEIEAGAVFINGLVKSDPRLPFGGIKNSGYGRELSLLGIMEFVNAKTVWVK